MFGLAELWRNRKDIYWKETLIYNLARAAAAGFIIGFLMIGDNAAAPLLYALISPFTYLCFILPAAFVLGMLNWVPYIGIAYMIFGILSIAFVSIGDPIIWLINRFFPGLLPVDHPALFNLSPLAPVVFDPAVGLPHE